MDNRITKVFEEHLSIDLIEVRISNSTDKEVLSKIKIRPVLLKNQLMFQVSEYKGKQIFHVNYSKNQVIEQLVNWFGEEAPVRLKQVEIQTKKSLTTILISKKGTVTIKTKKRIEDRKQDLSHNREKEYILSEGVPVPFLVDLGIQTMEGNIVSKKYDKFKQINRFLEFIEDILPSLPKDREVTIIDFGCGKSYLTFSMYYYLKELKQYDVKIIGLDLKDEVISHCNELSNRYGYHNLVFLQGDIATYEGVNQVDMVVSLHACDTATDYALYKAVKWNAKVILSVPCCQHEVNQQIKCEQLDSILKYGLIKERVAALITDGIRANILEEQGYKVQILEFIDMEHTPKNILIRGVKTGHKEKGSHQLMNQFLGVNSTLDELFKKE